MPSLLVGKYYLHLELHNFGALLCGERSDKVKENIENKN
jgi:hypothetical protein